MVENCNLDQEHKNIKDLVGFHILNFAGIPEHLFFYGIVLIVSLVLFAFFQFVPECFSLQIEDSKPSISKLLFGKEDTWLTEKRGIAAFHYIAFQRMILKLSLAFLTVSGASLAINASYNKGLTSATMFDATSSIMVPADSSWQWFFILVAFAVPWVVILCAIRFVRSLGKLKPQTETFNRTLLIDHLVGCDDWLITEECVEKYFAKEHPGCSVIKICFTRDTRLLQQKFLEIEF